jgi:hypothetical protein
MPTDRSKNLPEELRGGWLVMGRAAWLLLAGSTVALTLYGFLLRASEPVDDLLADAASKVGLGDPDLIVGFLIFSFTISVVAASYIFAKRSRSPMALLLSGLLILLAASGTRSLVLIFDTTPHLRWAVLVLWGATGVMFLLTLLLFPSGHFVPAWTRWLVVGLVLVDVLIPEFLEEIFRLPEVPEGVSTGRLVFSLVSFTFLCAVGGAAQVHRYRHFSTAVQRGQAKWVMYGQLWLAVSVVVGAAIPNLVANGSPGWIGWTLLLIFIPNTIIVPGSILVAVFKNHLYDIDVVINRTIVYGLMTTVLGALYAFLVFAFGALLAPFTAESDIAIAASTLAVAGLFRPLRLSVQRFIDKRFYRRRFDAQATLDDFTARMRQEVDIDALRSRLTGIVDEVMQPAHVSLWLRQAP